ncbi:hypothetical protein Aave_3504 [Paracidovorax citrulli AAC00-1]|uniref:Uncharacterized protein n=1 Tax=Paracidovorax citrulli (strain AAC00-1) TaxID=397945 RepID=A1TSX1_PARC0|nr:hypothetical protein Aave_3504 [Paracidovorax citrulli AAC00-1]
MIASDTSSAASASSCPSLAKQNPAQASGEVHRSAREGYKSVWAHGGMPGAARAGRPGPPRQAQVKECVENHITNNGGDAISAGTLLRAKFLPGRAGAQVWLRSLDSRHF